MNELDTALAAQLAETETPIALLDAVAGPHKLIGAYVLTESGCAPYELPRTSISWPSSVAMIRALRLSFEAQADALVRHDGLAWDHEQ